VVVPHPLIMNIPVCYALARQDRDLAEYINLWLELKKKDMTLQTFYDYWILGKTVGKRQPRWSILHDVLHWLD
jgi:ABC-type amino acid transport substrate-binding protein